MQSPKSLQPITLPPTSDHASKLLTTTHAFAKTLESPPQPQDLLNKFFTSHPKITEHGPHWARTHLPFLSKTFTGSSEFLEYFSLLSQTLSMKVDPTPGMENFAVSVGGGGKVFVESGGEFEILKTGKKWRERFVWRFSEFDEQGRIGHWEIWADPLSAWVAVGGDEGGE